MSDNFQGLYTPEPRYGEGTLSTLSPSPHMVDVGIRGMLVVEIEKKRDIYRQDIYIEICHR